MVKLPVALQLVGVGLFPLGALILFGVGWAVLAAACGFAVCGVALELERGR